MALNLSKNKIDKLIALLDYSDESSDLDDEDDNSLLEDIKTEVKDEADDSHPKDNGIHTDKSKTKIELNTINKLPAPATKNNNIEDTTNIIKVVKLEYKPIELDDTSESESDNEILTTEDDPNDPLNIKIDDKKLNIDLIYPKKNNINKTIPFKKKKSRIPLEKRVRCPICQAQRKNEEYLDLHMQTHDGKSEFECNVCGKFFSTTASVVRHQSLHEAAYKHQCEKCGKRFIFSSSLYSHKARHDDSRPFSCTVCNQTFKATKHLKRHMFIHTGERPFVCSVCGKAYSMKYMLKSHFKVHTRERHVCKICEKSFKRKNDFDKHMEWHLTGGISTNKRTNQQQSTTSTRKPRKKKTTTSNENNAETINTIQNHNFNNITVVEREQQQPDINLSINPLIPSLSSFQLPPIFHKFTTTNNNNVNS